MHLLIVNYNLRLNEEKVYRQDASGGSPRARGRLPLDPQFEMLLESRKEPGPCKEAPRRGVEFYAELI